MLLHLKRGTQVMLVANLDVEMGLVNGALGVVVGFVRTEKWNQPRRSLLANGEMSAWRGKHPFLPAVSFVCAPNKVLVVGPYQWSILAGNEMQEKVRDPMISVWP